MRIKQFATQIIVTHEMASFISYSSIISAGELYKRLEFKGGFYEKGANRKTTTLNTG